MGKSGACRGVGLVVLGLGGLLHVPAQAQDMGEGQAEAGEIVVTARLRAETLTETPLSISALTAEQLENRQIDSLRDLATMTPGLNFEQAAGPSNSRPIIRGQAQLGRTAGDVSNVGMFIDGVYSPGLTGTEIGFVGVERVEVVRGPQGALYGRNTFAGAINYITRRPGNALEFGGKGVYGENGLFEVSGYAATPIVEDRLAIRIDAGMSSSGGGLVNSVDGKRLDDIDAEMVRIGIKAQLGERLNLFFSGAYSHDTTSHSAVAVIPDTSLRRVGKPAPTARAPVQIGRRVSGRIDDYTESFAIDPRAFGSERTSRRFMLLADYDFGPVTLVSRTGYENRDVRTMIDLDQTPQGTNFATRPPAVYTQTASGDIEDRYEISQDLRLQATDPGRFDWTVGAYYSHERNRTSLAKFADPQLVLGGSVIAAPPVGGKAPIDQQDLNRNTFRSLYASAGYDMTDAINLTLEGRYTAERKQVRPLQDNYPAPAAALGPEQSRTFRYFTPRAILSYKPSRDLNIYLSAAKGTKSGGFNPQATLAAERVYHPESNWAYELGAKASLLDRKLQLSAALYHIDWSNQQILNFATGPVSGTDTTITTNIAKSRVDGGELSITYSPVRWFSLNAAYAYTNARYQDAVTSSMAGFVDCAALPRLECVNGVTTGNIGGNQLQFSPKHQGALGGEVTLPVGGAGLHVYARADLSFMSKRYVDAANAGYIPGRQELRLRLGLQTERMKAQLFCDNVTNDKTPVTAFEARDFLGNPHYYVRIRPPRQCGMSLAYAY